MRVFVESTASEGNQTILVWRGKGGHPGLEWATRPSRSGVPRFATLFDQRGVGPELEALVTFDGFSGVRTLP